MDYMRTVSFRANTWLLLIVLVWNVWPTSRTRSLGFVPGGTITVSGAQQRDKPPCVLDLLSCKLEFHLLFQKPAKPQNNGDHQGPDEPPKSTNTRTKFVIDGITFRAVGIFDDFRREGASVTFHAETFVSSDGKRSAYGFLIYKSLQDASEDMETALSHAFTTVQREERAGKDNSGHEKRAVALFCSTDSKETLARVMWTDGRTFREIVSESLQNALALEKASAPRDSKSK
jgi:hypothetical protein